MTPTTIATMTTDRLWDLYNAAGDWVDAADSDYAYTSRLAVYEMLAAEINARVYRG